MTSLHEEIKKAFLRAGYEVTKEDLSAAIKEVARDAADNILYEGNTYLNDEGISDEGTLAGSGFVAENNEGGYDVVWAAEHADWINYGTEPHSVSEEGQRKILEWVARKLKPTPNPGETQAACYRRVANAIVWSIRKQGSDPKPFADVAVERTQTMYGQR